MANVRKIPVVPYPGKAGTSQLDTIIKARQSRDKEVSEKVEKIIDDIRKRGDKALIEYTEKFDHATLTAKTIRITREELAESAARIKPELKAAIDEAAKRIKNYHKKQTRTGFSLKTKEGTLHQIIRPLNRVGVYIPGGKTIYPSTVLMDIIPAQIAGVKEIAAVTPPRSELDPGIAYALHMLGIEEIYRCGGAQAVAALAYGTKTIKRVDKIVGPGNQFVTAAKRLVFGAVDIDSLAGPSEVTILADASVSPEWVALDMLSQAEHGSGDEIAICVCEDKAYAVKISKAILDEIKKSPVKEVLDALPEHAISIFVTSSREESIELVNEIATEHLQIMTSAYAEDVKKITNAAAIFLGAYTPVALGDYFIGTNHVLPTSGAARYASPLGVDSFVKRMSIAEVSAEGLDLAAPFVSTFARTEGFVHHALSVEKRG